MFEKLVGNDAVKQYLENQISNKLVSHAYLFLGKESIGKKEFAREYLKNVLCKDEVDKLKFDTEAHPDYMMIEDDNNKIKIEQIRELQKKIYEKPILSDKKAYIINNADKMTKEAQNCLLKTLEEPPNYAIIILIANNLSSLLETIISRTIIVNFEDIKNEELLKIKPDLTSQELQLLDGSFKDIDIVETKIDEYNKIEDIISNLKSKKLVECMTQADILYDLKDNKDEKDKIYSVLETMNLILFKYGLIDGIEVVEHTKDKIRRNNNYEMSIDYLIINLYEKINN